LRYLKKAIFLCMFLSIFLISGCTSQSTKNQLNTTPEISINESDDTGKSTDIQLPENKPNDFDFVFKFGVGAKNQLDTINGQFTLDMVSQPSVTTNLKLSDEEMNTIYSEMKKINILSYPVNFNPKSNTSQTPFDTYYIIITADGKEKEILWRDENVSMEKEAVQLRELFRKLKKIITDKEEFKKLPKPTSGYL
jgi:hypothetical protein